MHNRTAEWEPRCGERVAVRIVHGEDALDPAGDVLGDGDDRLYTLSVLPNPHPRREPPSGT